MSVIKDFLNKLNKQPEDTRERIEHFYAESSAGTENYSGYYDEEYLKEIQGREFADIVDRMRRSDDQITMLLNLIKTPIINATWTIEVAEDKEKAEQVKEFLEKALFEDFNFKEFIEDALTFFDFGHSLFEVVYRPLIGDKFYGDAILLKDLSFISQRTIEEWHLKQDSTLKCVRQLSYGDLARDVFIDSNNLLVFTLKKEGANHEGRSLLRPIYGNWLRKDKFHKIQSIGVERSAVGIPVGVSRDGATKEERSVIQKILSSITSHQKSSIVVPSGTDIKNFQIAFDPEKVQKVINAERLGMSQSFLAGFMDLGTNSSTGSFALSNNLSTVFYNSLQHYADKIVYQLQQKVIKDLVQFNFGELDFKPKLKVSNISDRLGKEFSEILQNLSNSGHITTSRKTEEFLREKFKLPELDEQEEEKVEKVKKEEVNKANLSDIKHFALKKSQARSLISQNRQKLKELMQTELTERRDDLLKKAKSILEREGKVKARKEVLSLSLPRQREYKDNLFNSFAELTLESINGVKSELGINNMTFAENIKKDKDYKNLPKNTRVRVEEEADLMAKTQDSDLEKSIFFAFNNNYDYTDSPDKLISEMKEASDQFISGPSVNASAGNSAANLVNNARNDVYQTPQVFETIDSFTITNPDPDSAICKNLAGRVISKEDYKNGELPPYHHNCDSIVVANLKNESNLPKINPLGLNYTGTEGEIERIIKSKTL